MHYNVIVAEPSRIATDPEDIAEIDALLREHGAELCCPPLMGGSVGDAAFSAAMSKALEDPKEHFLEKEGV